MRIFFAIFEKGGLYVVSMKYPNSPPRYPDSPLKANIQGIKSDSDAISTAESHLDLLNFSITFN